MGNGGMISICMDSAHRWILHGDGQKPREDTFNGGSGFILFFELFCAIVDLCSDSWFESNQSVAPFSIEEFLVQYWTRDVLASDFWVIDNGARILTV